MPKSPPDDFQSLLGGLKKKVETANRRLTATKTRADTAQGTADIANEAAAEASAAADQAVENAKDALQHANDALTSANGKNHNTYANGAPPNPDTDPHTDGDRWFVMTSDGHTTGMYLWSAKVNAWQQQILNGAVLAQLDAGTISTGYLAAARIAASTISAAQLVADTLTSREIGADAILARNIKAGEVIAGKLAANAVTAVTIAADAINGKTITGAIIRTAASGRRTETTITGLAFYRTDGTAAGVLNPDTNNSRVILGLPAGATPDVQVDYTLIVGPKAGIANPAVSIGVASGRDAEFPALWTRSVRRSDTGQAIIDSSGDNTVVYASDVVDPNSGNSLAPLVRSRTRLASNDGGGIWQSGQNQTLLSVSHTVPAGRNAILRAYLDLQTYNSSQAYAGNLQIFLDSTQVAEVRYHNQSKGFTFMKWGVYEFGFPFSAGAHTIQLRSTTDAANAHEVWMVRGEIQVEW